MHWQSVVHNGLAYYASLNYVVHNGLAYYASLNYVVL